MSKFGSALKKALLGSSPSRVTKRNGSSPAAGTPSPGPGTSSRAAGPAPAAAKPPAPPKSQKQRTASVIRRARKRAVTAILATLVVLFIALIALFLLTGPPTQNLESRLNALVLVVTFLTLANMMLLVYLGYAQAGLLLRRPNLGIQVRNPQGENRPVVFARRENVIEIALLNSGSTTAKYVHAAFRWSGGHEISMRESDGSYLDRRYWSEGEGTVRLFSGGHERVILAGRQMTIAELHVSRPHTPVKLGYRLFCEDMDEIQGEIEFPLREVD